ncbi:MAG: HD-GYP domain-containing protein [Chloroflexi bacterium]|nr:HD-GYP domain-containing protein [Chloroflexota bacterium]
MRVDERLDQSVNPETGNVEPVFAAMEPILALIVLGLVAIGLTVALAKRASRHNSVPTRVSILHQAVETIAGIQERQEIIRAALTFAMEATGARFSALGITRSNENSILLHSLFDGQLRSERVGLAGPTQPPPAVESGVWHKDERATVYSPLCVVPSHYPSVDSPVGVRFQTTYGEIGELFVANMPEPASSEDEASLALLANQVKQYLEYQALLQQINHGYMETIEALVKAIEAKDAYTRGHSDRVTKYAVATAREMALPPEQLEEIRIGAVLHDIGKIGVPESIINKPGRLDDDEWRLMKDHPRMGTKIIDSFNRSRDILLMIYHHHEMYDGTGYPAGLRGNEIPLAARILKVADAFEAMTSNRSYQKSKTVEEAIQELKDWSGRQFDPLVVSAFLRAMRSRAYELDVRLIEV